MDLQFLRKKKFWFFLSLGIVLVLVGSQLPLQAWLATAKTWLKTLGWWAAPVFMSLYLLATILGLPNVVLIFLAGTLFGLLQGIAYVSIADTLGAIACYGLGRTIARERIRKWMDRNPNFKQLDQAVEEKGWKLLLLTRLSPIIPSNLLNYGFSCTKVNFWQYLFFTWLGMLPIIAFYVYLGAFGMALTQGDWTPQKIALQAVGLIVTIAAVIYTTRLSQKYLSAPPANEATGACQPAARK